MINIQTPICNTGYGIAGFNIVKTLSSITDLNLFILGQPDPNLLSESIRNSWICENKKHVNVNAPTIKIWHQHDLFDRVGKGPYIGFPIFELDTFTDIEKKSLKSCDYIAVCSEWAKSIIEQEIGISSDKIFVIPLGIDRSIFQPVNFSRPGNTIFFNCGKWEVRKGHDIILKCFEESFSEEDNVELWMMCENPFPFARGEEWEKMYLESRMANRIKLIPRVNLHQSVYNIMKQVDCGIFPARAEGWNLELLELMSIGKQVITINYSGHTEFCNNQNSLLVDVNSKELAIDNIWFNGQGKWAKIADSQIGAICQHMKTVHESKQSGSLCQNTHGIETGNRFTWNNTAKKILSMIEEIK